MAVDHREHHIIMVRTLAYEYVPLLCGILAAVHSREDGHHKRVQPCQYELQRAGHKLEMPVVQAFLVTVVPLEHMQKKSIKLLLPAKKKTTLYCKYKAAR